MKNSWLLIGLLVLASLLVDLVVLLAVGAGIWGPLFWPHPTFVLLMALCLSQVNLVAVWAGLSSQWIPWRLMGVSLVLGFWGIRSETESTHTEILFTICCAFVLMLTAMILAASLIARWRGVRLARVLPGDSAPKGLGAARRWQFSLSYLFAWTTAIAVTLSVLQYIGRYKRCFLVWTDVSIWIRLAPIYIGQIALALAGFWTVLDARRPMLRVAVFLCVVTGSAVAMAQTIEDFNWPPVVGLHILEALLLISSLCVCRAAGYIVTRERGRPEPAQRSSGT